MPKKKGVMNIDEATVRKAKRHKNKLSKTIVDLRMEFIEAPTVSRIEEDLKAYGKESAELINKHGLFSDLHRKFS